MLFGFKVVRYLDEDGKKENNNTKETSGAVETASEPSPPTGSTRPIPVSPLPANNNNGQQQVASGDSSPPKKATLVENKDKLESFTTVSSLTGRVLETRVLETKFLSSDDPRLRPLAVVAPPPVVVAAPAPAPAPVAVVAAPPPPEPKPEEDFDDGTLCGIGVALTQDRQSGAILIGHVTPGGPADLCSIRVGDIIRTVNSVDVQFLPGDVVARMIMGRRGSAVDIGVESEMGFTRHTMVRQVKGKLPPDFAAAAAAAEDVLNSNGFISRGSVGGGAGAAPPPIAAPLPGGGAGAGGVNPYLLQRERERALLFGGGPVDPLLAGIPSDPAFRNFAAGGPPPPLDPLERWRREQQEFGRFAPREPPPFLAGGGGPGGAFQFREREFGYGPPPPFGAPPPPFGARFPPAGGPPPPFGGPPPPFDPYGRRDPLIPPPFGGPPPPNGRLGSGSVDAGERGLLDMLDSVRRKEEELLSSLRERDGPAGRFGGGPRGNEGNINNNNHPYLPPFDLQRLQQQQQPPFSLQQQSPIGTSIAQQQQQQQQQQNGSAIPPLSPSAAAANNLPPPPTFDRFAPPPQVRPQIPPFVSRFDRFDRFDRPLGPSTGSLSRLDAGGAYGGAVFTGSLPPTSYGPPSLVNVAAYAPRLPPNNGGIGRFSPANYEDRWA